MDITSVEPNWRGFYSVIIDINTVGVKKRQDDFTDLAIRNISYGKLLLKC